MWHALTPQPEKWRGSVGNATFAVRKSAWWGVEISSLVIPRRPSGRRLAAAHLSSAASKDDGGPRGNRLCGNQPAAAARTPPNVSLKSTQPLAASPAATRRTAATCGFGSDSENSLIPPLPGLLKRRTLSQNWRESANGSFRALGRRKMRKDLRLQAISLIMLVAALLVPAPTSA